MCVSARAREKMTKGSGYSTFFKFGMSSDQRRAMVGKERREGGGNNTWAKKKRPSSPLPFSIFSVLSFLLVFSFFWNKEDSLFPYFTVHPHEMLKNESFGSFFFVFLFCFEASVSTQMEKMSKSASLRDVSVAVSCFFFCFFLPISKTAT